MLVPGRIYPGTQIDLDITFRTEAGTLADPETVALKLYSEQGDSTQTFTYGTSAELTRASVGVYSCAVTPTHGGRWHYRWETTGTGSNFAIEDNFIVKISPFVGQPYNRPREYT